MARTLSAGLRAAMLAENTTEGLIILLTISHPSLQASLYICSHRDGVTSNGQAFIFVPFEITFPSEDRDQPPAVSLQVDNVDRRMVEAVRTVAGTGVPISVRFEVVTDTNRDLVEVGPYDFTMTNVVHNRQHVAGTLTYENVSTQRAIKGRFGPAKYPNLHA